MVVHTDFGMVGGGPMGGMGIRAGFATTLMGLSKKRINH